MAQPLQIRFGTDASEAGKAIQNLAAGIAGNMASAGSAVVAVTKNIDTMSSTLGNVATMARSALPALVAIGGAVAIYQAVSAAVDAAKESVSEFIKIGNQAQAAGVGGGFFQRWQGEAANLNLEVSKLVAMLDRARAASTVSIGEGDNASSSPGGRRLEQNVLAGNLSRGDVATYQGARSQEDRIRAVLDLIDKLQAAQKNLAAFDLAKTFFGPDFEKLLRDGVDATGKMRANMDSTAGVAGGKRVVSDAEIQNARELNAQLITIENKLASGLAPVQEDLVRLGQDQYKGWLDIKQGIATAVESAGELYKAVRAILAELDKFAGRDPVGQLATNLGADRVRQSLGIPEGWGEDLKRRLGFSPGEQFGPQIPAGFKPQDAGYTGTGDKSAGLPSLNKAAGSDSEEKTALDRYIEQLTKANALAQAEVELVGKTNVERQTALALTRARVAADQDVKDGKRDSKSLTEIEVANITHLAEVEQRAKDIAADLNQTLRQNADAMRYLGSSAADALGQIIVDGGKASDVMANLARQLAKQSITALLTGTGPLAGILGTAPLASAGPNAIGGGLGILARLLGLGGSNPYAAGAGGYTGMGPFIPGVPGNNAEGTDNWRGGMTWVGEKGPELINLPRGAQVIPNDRAMGGAVDNSRSYHIDARGAQAGVAEQITAALRVYDRELNRTLPARVLRADQRY